MPHPTHPAASSGQPASLALLVRGLRIDAQSVEGGVVNLAVRANEQHKGVFGRLRQHLANALFRAADACHPGQDNGPLWVVSSVVVGAAADNHLADLADDRVRYVWPRHYALGEAHYQPLLIHEGVKRHQDGRPVSERFLRSCGQKRAEYVHADLSGLKNVIVDAEGGAA